MAAFYFSIISMLKRVEKKNNTQFSPLIEHQYFKSQIVNHPYLITNLLERVVLFAELALVAKLCIEHQLNI